MRLKTRGKNISDVEVSNIGRRGLWVFVEGKEYFLSYEEYPWFKDAKVGEILKVKMLRGGHLYWPDIDVDLEVDCLANPEKYPLKYR
jgi:hypothetical protein